MFRLMIIALCFLAPTISFAQEFNAGIVQGLWYSQEKVFADVPIRIYIAIRNNTGSDLTGTVEFYDGDKRIDRKSVQALDGRIIESWADWSPTYGTHILKATISRIELHKVGSSTQSVEVISAVAEDTIAVDYDTDKDNVGNGIDADDDGDGVSDTQEKENGTNPLVKNVVLAENTQTSNATANNTDDEDEESDNDEDDTDNNGTEGLEQYLAPSPAETVLSGVTNYITQTKNTLDTYREERAKNLQGESEKKLEVNEDGFGAITRTQDGETVASTTNEAQKEVLEEGAGFLDKFLNIVGTLFSTIYTIVLATLSFILAHPIFVQLGILILILFLLIKLASKFGRRKNRG